MAWFFRGAQSAFFYYASCAPCSNARFNHRRAKEKARVDKATKRALLQNASRLENGELAEKMHADDADLLAGVGAFTTNIYWQEEIDIGPNFKKGMRPRQDLTGDRKDNKRKSRGRTASGKNAMGDRGPGRGTNAANASLDTLRNEGGKNDGDAANRPMSSMSGNRPQRYQRADEALWGTPFPEKDWNYYARGRNPPINELAPPVVSSLPATADEASWMLQPPPPAKIMEGKQAPVKRTTSIGAASKASVVSKISKRSGGTRFSELKRPEKVIIANLDENICSMSLPPPAERRGLRRIFRTDGATDSSRPTTPEYGHARQDSAISAFSTFESPSRNISRVNRPPPIQTLVDSDVEPGRDALGFDPYFTFPRRAVAQTLESSPEPMSTVSSHMDGLYYHSEPEPDLAYSHGIAFQDFAQQSIRSPTIPESEVPFQTPKSKATTRAGSNSPSPRTLSPDSSSSSLHDVLRDVLAPAVIMDAEKPPNHETPFAAQGDLPHMEGITEEDMENVIPRFSAGPREVRLGSGTQV